MWAYMQERRVEKYCILQVFSEMSSKEQSMLIVFFSHDEELKVC